MLFKITFELQYNQTSMSGTRVVKKRNQIYRIFLIKIYTTEREWKKKKNKYAIK